MIIEKNKKEIIIRLPANIDTIGLQSLVDFLTYKEATAKSVAKQTDVDLLSDQVKSGWWLKNKVRLIK